MLKNIEKYSDEINYNNSEIIYTKTNINNIENILNNFFDKYDIKCKYYIDITENIYWISFNVGYEQIEEMHETMFSLKIFKDIDNNSILILSKEITENHNWNDIYLNFLKTFKV